MRGRPVSASATAVARTPGELSLPRFYRVPAPEPTRGGILLNTKQAATYEQPSGLGAHRDHRDLLAGYTAPRDCAGVQGGVAPLLTLANPRARSAQRSSPEGCRSHSRASHIATQNTKDNPSKSSHIPARDWSVPGSDA
jgi:hypothetical protein